jgi:hypothetical protein
MGVGAVLSLGYIGKIPEELPPVGQSAPTLECLTRYDLLYCKWLVAWGHVSLIITHNDCKKYSDCVFVAQIHLAGVGVGTGGTEPSSKGTPINCVCELPNMANIFFCSSSGKRGRKVTV